MIRQKDRKDCAVIFNGEIYNMKSLRNELERKGAKFQTTSDTEVILVGYMRYGAAFCGKIEWDLLYCHMGRSLKKAVSVSGPPWC